MCVWEGNRRGSGGRRVVIKQKRKRGRRRRRKVLCQQASRVSITRAMERLPEPPDALCKKEKKKEKINAF